jgi:hypothetical protein
MLMLLFFDVAVYIGTLIYRTIPYLCLLGKSGRGRFFVCMYGSLYNHTYKNSLVEFVACQLEYVVAKCK